MRNVNAPNASPMPTEQIVYQANAAMQQHVHQAQAGIQNALQQCKNRPVAIQTMDGQMHEGILTDVQGGIVYLLVPQPQPPVSDPRFFNPLSGPAYYNNVILPLVLYELLVITLLL